MSHTGVELASKFKEARSKDVSKQSISYFQGYHRWGSRTFRSTASIIPSVKCRLIAFGCYTCRLLVGVPGTPHTVILLGSFVPHQHVNETW